MPLSNYGFIQPFFPFFISLFRFCFFFKENNVSCKTITHRIELRGKFSGQRLWGQLKQMFIFVCNRIELMSTGPKHLAFVWYISTWKISRAIFNEKRRFMEVEEIIAKKNDFKKNVHISITILTISRDFYQHKMLDWLICFRKIERKMTPLAKKCT